ncbi:MAG: LPXTG cell wall anchor domain-containing protein [Oscillospiraceae bacterium]|nr:LPXTG cell wall anchor domain-containing protein [Oscillospiraceae bacterium]
MMKRIFGCLLIAALLFSLAIMVGAETVTDGDYSVNPLSAEVTDPDPSSESEESLPQIVIVPSKEDLPDGYEIDEDFYIHLNLTAENGWFDSRTWEEIFKEAIDDGGDYIYFIDEENIPAGYVAYYSLVSPELTDGHILIIKNVKQGEPPVYELPETGAAGTTYYTLAGTAILLIAAAYGLFLYRKRRNNA